MRKAAAIVSVLLLVGSAHAQCCGDCDGNGEIAVNELVAAVGNALDGVGGCGDCDGNGAVAVNELVTAVGNALDGCELDGQGCPWRFTDDLTGVSDLCVYEGLINDQCGRIWDASFSGDGDVMAVGIFEREGSGSAFFGATVTSPTRADIALWTRTADGSPEILGGEIGLEDNGTLLIVVPSRVPFTAGLCPMIAYAGVLMD